MRTFVLFSHRRFRYFAWILAVNILFALQVSAENKALKGELEHSLSGKTMVSKVVFGGRAIPRGYQADYPVNTLVYPDSGEMTFRVEWGLMRAEVDAREMLRYFDRGTSFRVSNIDLKDDRLELKLESGGGDSARLKLMLGAGWQSKFDISSIQTQLARVFVLDQPQQAAAATTVAAGGGSTATQSTIGGVSSTSAYQRDPSAPKVEGRISDEDLRAVMAGFDEQIRLSLSTLSQDAAVLARGLLTYQKAYSGRSDYTSRPQLQAISQLQDQLGKALKPQRDDDVIAMSEVFKRCVRVAQLGQARDERGNLLGANSAGFEQLLLSDSAADVSRNAERDVEVERAQRSIIDSARANVINIEQTLDRGDLIGANRLYQQMSADGRVAQVPPVQQYLKRMTGFRQDLASYVQVAQLDRRREASVSQQLQNLRMETDLLNASQAKPITRRYLQDTVRADTEAARSKLANLPAFHFEEASYKVPRSLSETSPSNLNDKLTFISGRITDIDTRLTYASELRAIVTQPAAMKTVEELIGANEAATLNQSANQLATAERTRASLVADQQTIQQHIETAKAQAAAKVMAAIALRQQFADDLTKRMSNEIWWCAGGRNGELLAGYITTSQLSPATFAQIGTASPLWKELYGKGFRFSGVFDRDQTTKTAAITASGATGAPITAISDQDRAYLEHAIDVLMQKANGASSAGACVPETAPDACPDGQVRQFMPSVGYICTSR